MEVMVLVVLMLVGMYPCSGSRHISMSEESVPKPVMVDPTRQMRYLSNIGCCILNYY